MQKDNTQAECQPYSLDQEDDILARVSQMQIFVKHEYGLNPTVKLLVTVGFCCKIFHVFILLHTFAYFCILLLTFVQFCMILHTFSILSYSLVQFCMLLHTFCLVLHNFVNFCESLNPFTYTFCLRLHNLNNFEQACKICIILHTNLETDFLTRVIEMYS